VAPALISSKRIEGVLGWRPEVDFETGIQELLDSAADPG
jgi:hypothetical protein